ncbi:endonuclease V [Halapricum desulfuricans]|uniref:Endonuclease V n=1 Tax=Halapricum desulfuricans TaxID=2841257 RepID=A0A897MZY9_9EURY|nr:endonuclease V [Halapricum desulfuricans]QSG06232.1 Deoxyinosine 3'endonuclease (endonuclease V) [Halapricum desulfuricans]
MEPVRPEFVPDPSLSREAMEALQDEIAAAAVFEDDLAFDPGDVTVDRDGDQRSLVTAEPPVIAGVDQAFLDDDRAVSAAVALRAGEVIDEATAVAETEIPYIPGLLSFREGNAVLAALQSLSVTPDLTVVDGSGRIHFRQAGLATHVGVTLDRPTVGVAKSLLCGTPREPVPDRLPEGARIPIEADDGVTAPDGTVIGYAYQSRQYDRGSTSINPLYVSPGHRISAETAVEVVERTCGGYKLPEPTRLADALADEAKAEFG